MISFLVNNQFFLLTTGHGQTFPVAMDNTWTTVCIVAILSNGKSKNAFVVKEQKQEAGELCFIAQLQGRKATPTTITTEQMYTFNCVDLSNQK